MRNYNNIQFSEGLSMPLAEFKKVYKETHYFKSLDSKERERELEKAYKVATNGNIKKSTKKRKESEADSVGATDVPDNTQD